MKVLLQAWKTILGWGLIFTGVYMVGAVIDMVGVSGTCMFVLMPYFASLAVTIPLLKVNCPTSTFPTHPWPATCAFSTRSGSSLCPGWW